MDRMNQPGAKGEDCIESHCITLFIPRTKNYEKRALMHHSFHVFLLSPENSPRISIMLSQGCAAPIRYALLHISRSLKLRRSYACVPLPRKCRFPKCMLSVVVRLR